DELIRRGSGGAELRNSHRALEGRATGRGALDVQKAGLVRAPVIVVVLAVALAVVVVLGHGQRRKASREQGAGDDAGAEDAAPGQRAVERGDPSGRFDGHVDSPIRASGTVFVRSLFFKNPAAEPVVPYGWRTVGVQDRGPKPPRCQRPLSMIAWHCSWTFF